MNSVSHSMCNSTAGDRREYATFAESDFPLRCLGSVAWIGMNDPWQTSRATGSVSMIVGEGMAPRRLPRAIPARRGSGADRTTNSDRDTALREATR
jgi:hypothetical protein